MKKTKSLLRRVFSSTLLLFNLGAILWLFLCYAASIISPLEFGYISFFSLTTPFALLANLLFIALWLFSSRKWKALFSIVALLCCWKMVPAVLGFHIFPTNDWERSQNSFKVMTWNVHAMGVFSNPKEAEHAEAVMDLISAQDADILCLPEYAVHADPKKRVYTPKIKKANSYKYFHFTEDNDYGQAIRLGTAVFSKYPVVFQKEHPLGKYIYMLQCDVEVSKGNIISVYVLHLQSFGLSDDDKALIEEVKQQPNTNVISHKGRSYAWKFRRAYQIRATQAEMAAAIISRSKHPVIICGDFNDLPFSYTYRTIRGKLQDAFASKGTGFGRTYNQIIPTLRIDYILYDENALKVKAFETLSTQASDHNPVIANFEIIDSGKR